MSVARPPSHLILALFAASFLCTACRSPSGPTGPAIEPQAGPTTAPAEAHDRPADARLLIPDHGQSLTIGESASGRPIDLYVFGEGGETTLILGGIHGNEPTSSDVAIELVCYLQQHPEAYAGRCVMIAPSVNPDGLAARKRGNINGIDINRNFPAANFPRTQVARFAGGRQPVSEPETRAIMDAVQHARPAKIISLHSIRRGRHGNNYDGPARALAEEMARHNGYPVLPTMGYDTPGSLGSWTGVDQQVATITLELPRDADGAACWNETRESLLAAIRFPMQTPAGVDPPLLGK